MADSPGSAPRKRTRTDHSSFTAVTDEDWVALAKLPHELLLESWFHLPPLERMCVSQTCSLWRSLALATPRLWTRVAAVSGRSTDSFSALAPAQASGTKTTRSRSRSSNIYNPRADSNNLDLMAALYERSRQLPLDLTILWRSDGELPDKLYAALKPHSHRLARVHIAEGAKDEFARFVAQLGRLPNLRTLTAGYNEDKNEFADYGVWRVERGPLPALTQIRLGGATDPDFVPWRQPTVPLSAVFELTLTPSGVPDILPALAACRNLAHLTLCLGSFRATAAPAQLQRFSDAAAKQRTLTLADFPSSRERIVRQLAHDARLRAVTLDYHERARAPSAAAYLKHPGLCDVLSGPVRLTVRLRESMYSIEALDGSQRRREIVLGSSTIHLALGIWDAFLGPLTVASATVDAVAWDYFTASIPEGGRNVPWLTVVVSHDPAELDGVSLGKVTGIKKLRIEVVQHGLRFSRGAVSRLLKSRADSRASSPILSLTKNARFGELVSESTLSDSLKR